MKSRLLLSIFMTVLIFLAESALAQGKKNFGIRSGYQISGLFNGSDRVSGTSNYASFYAGAFKEKKIFSFLHLGTGLEYCQNGADMDNGNKHVIKYLGLPIDLKAKIGPVYALVGVQPKFKLSEKILINDKKTNPADEQKSSFMDFPAFGGMGVNIFFLSIEARYHYSIFEINDGIRNAYLQLGATLHI